MTAASLSVFACTDTTGVDQTVVDMVLDYCGAQTPTFFAYQNEGGAWTAVTPNASGTVSFKAAGKVAIAQVFQSGSDYQTQVLYTTAAELAPLNNVSCVDDQGSKTLNGSVAGLTLTQEARITMGAASTLVFSNTGYTLNNVPNGAVDLAASSETFTSSTITSEIPNKVVLRRGLNVAATISQIDFSSEGFTPSANTVTMGGLVSGEVNEFFVDFATATRTVHELQFVSGFTSGSQTVYGVPSGQLVTGDYHQLAIDAATNGNFTNFRGITAYYRAPQDRTVTLAASLNAPSASVAGTAPYVRMHATLASQSDYTSLVVFGFDQSPGGNQRQWVLLATKGYYGGTAPTTWDLTIPDLSGVSGFPLAAGLQSGQSTTFYAEASDGRPALVLASDLALPNDPETVRFAYREQTIATMRAEGDATTSSPLPRGRRGMPKVFGNRQ